MGRFDATKATIDANIKSNGNHEITGAILNSVMKGMVDATDAELTQLSAEVGKKVDADFVNNAIAAAITTTLNEEV